MRFAPISLIFAMAVVSSCSDNQADDRSKTDFVRPAKEVQAMREIAGRWQSEEAPLPGMDGKYLVVDIANDHSISMEVRKDGPKMAEISAEARGSFEEGENFTRFSGTLKDAPATLSAFKSFRFYPPEKGAIKLEGERGSVELFFKGL